MLQTTKYFHIHYLILLRRYQDSHFIRKETSLKSGGNRSKVKGISLELEAQTLSLINTFSLYFFNEKTGLTGHLVIDSQCNTTHDLL